MDSPPSHLLVTGLLICITWQISHFSPKDERLFLQILLQTQPCLGLQKELKISLQPQEQLGRLALCILSMLILCRTRAFIMEGTTYTQSAKSKSKKKKWKNSMFGWLTLRAVKQGNSPCNIT
ncbi:uncharacterized protein LOC111412143 isoform X2 [Olea europaea var. sylvestris]|uniref:uncharacterized protein LOC111412143 isoform X2 n=1 Tax=Olea europaea var. sylvestris TaxID=158386 RepID=UPI000C1D8C66|nr:uncharacterized protein LOC111412143 isoform X2 [Olea europaea var. sylvestris]XP_022898699.1 uncharacterized protein LOC111412143 isoform X2 [Olea europaea var. sylvestris]XP_022898700.1 uncharacterized protein LOC111412143 isoform X2 [Olea europaea var. sylvestris]